MDEKSLKNYLTGLYAGEILASMDYSQACCTSQERNRIKGMV